MNTSSTTSEPRNRTPWWAWGCSAQLGPRDLANYRRMNYLFMAWGFLFVAGVLILARWAATLGPFAYVIAAVPTVVFLLGAASYVRFLRNADELTRKIHMEGMAVGFGAGLTVLLAYPILETAGAPPMDLSLAVIPAVAGYVFGVYRAQRRYR